MWPVVLILAIALAFPFLAIAWVGFQQYRAGNRMFALGYGLLLLGVIVSQVVESATGSRLWGYNLGMGIACVGTLLLVFGNDRVGTSARSRPKWAFVIVGVWLVLMFVIARDTRGPEMCPHWPRSC
jgi:hypothetical protein